MSLDPRTVIVCGGRGFAAPLLRDGRVNTRLEEQVRTLHSELAALQRELMFTRLVHGDAEGADRAAGIWAMCLTDLDVVPVPVLHGEHPKLRNERMWQLHTPLHVLAFPGGGGTAHMVEYARSRGSLVTLLPRPRDDRGGRLL